MTNKVADNTLGATSILIVINSAAPSTATPEGDLALTSYFENSDDLLCPVTYSITVENADSFTDDKSSLFAIDDATKKMLFTYSEWDTKTIHYKVTATTAANEPLT